MTTPTSGDPAAAGQGAPAGEAPPGAGPDDTAAVLRDLATSVALLPQAPLPEGQEQPEGVIALPVIEQDGQRYIPVFTSEEALRSAGADVSTALRIPIAELAANWPADDMWLAVNPASEEGLGLPPEIVRMLPGFVGSPDGDGGATAGGDGNPPG